MKTKVQRKKHVRLDEARRAVFLQHCRDTGVLGIAAELTDVSRDCVEDHRRDDKDFDAAVKEALQVYGDRLEERVLERALNGDKRSVYFRGDVCGELTEFSDTIQLAVLRKHKPEYRDKQTIDHHVSGGVMVVGARPTEQEWAETANQGTDGEQPAKH